ncbi:hypothetical protein [Haloechinothrix sp. LS1_15]|uniref:hypothetical protein n=1 Tax=Haloechinothrix sp. LS1_15 TaxID=2652248 RepID=UPI002945C944|nr:hypothetical protein [Haloechinothrix sp. LS1_15]MDV6014734.1 hypothetical protein [Haloechinothrix sp. LS1_15]
MEQETARRCHDLLLHLAGRLPDELLWRYRDWLAEGALPVLARTLPKALLKHGIDVEGAEYELLAGALLPHGADRDLVSAALGVDVVTRTRYTFSENAPEWMTGVDTVAAVIHATLRGRPDVGEVRQSWRYGSDGEDPDVKRVLLVTALDGLPRLTAELQRVVRVLGDEVPSVEVASPDFEAGEYHRTALARSTLLCIGGVETGGGAAAA